MTTTHEHPAMTASAEQTAVAFSTHRFAEVYDALAADVTWTARGAGPALVGKDAVVAACESSLAEIQGSESTLLELRTVVGEQAVAVETVTRYAAGGDGACVVASTDLYDFTADGAITAITSYAAEV